MKSRAVFLTGIVMPLFGLVADDAASRSSPLIFAQASPPEVCTQIYQPVCGTDKEGKRVTYSNACLARVANASNVTPGQCPR